MDGKSRDSSIQSGKFVNNGTIGINGTGGKGINITGANVKTENNGTIEVNGEQVELL